MGRIKGLTIIHTGSITQGISMKVMKENNYTCSLRLEGKYLPLFYDVLLKDICEEHPGG